MRGSGLGGEQGCVGPQVGEPLGAGGTGQRAPVVSLATCRRWVPRGTAATQAISSPLKVTQPGFSEDDRDIYVQVSSRYVLIIFLSHFSSKYNST